MSGMAVFPRLQQDRVKVIEVTSYIIDYFENWRKRNPCLNFERETSTRVLK